MLYYSCVMGPDSLHCGKWRKISKSRSDLDLGPTMLNMELVRDIFICNNVFKFHVPRSITFLSYCAHTHTHRIWRVLYSCVSQTKATTCIIKSKMQTTQTTQVTTNATEVCPEQV